MVKGFPPIQEQTSSCETYIIAKKQVKNLPKKMSYRAKASLGIVYTYFCGLMQTHSLGRSYYFLTFIDDYSTRLGCIFLVKNSETFIKIKEFKALMENKSG